MKRLNKPLLFLFLVGILLLGCSKTIDYNKEEIPKSSSYFFLPVVKMELTATNLFDELFKTEVNQIKILEREDGVLYIEKDLSIESINLTEGDGIKFINSSDFKVDFEYNASTSFTGNPSGTGTRQEKLPKKAINYTFFLNQTQNNYLTKIQFKKGTAVVTIDNSANSVDLELEMVLSSFKSKDNNTSFTKNISVPKNSISEENIDLENYYLDLTTTPIALETSRVDLEAGNNYNQFRGELTPTVTFLEKDGLTGLEFDFSIDFKNREIQYVEGILNDVSDQKNPKKITVEPTEFSGLDLGELNEVTFNTISLNLAYQNGVGFEMDIESILEGYNSEEDEVNASVKNVPSPTTLNYPKKSTDPKASGTIDFENLSPVISNSKDRMVMQSTITLKNDKVGFFNADSLIDLTAKLNMPLDFKSSEFSYYETELDISGDNLDIAKKMQLIFLVKNELGLDFSLGVRYNHENQTKNIFMVDENLEPIEAITSEEFGKGTYREYKITLNEQHINELKKSSEKKLLIGYRTPEGGTVVKSQGSFNLSLNFAIQINQID